MHSDGVIPPHLQQLIDQFADDSEVTAAQALAICYHRGLVHCEGA